jgi:hypothetical protein
MPKLEIHLSLKDWIRKAILRELARDGPVIIDEDLREVVVVCQCPENKSNAIEYDTVMKRFEFRLRGGYRMCMDEAFLRDLFKLIPKVKKHAK